MVGLETLKVLPAKEKPFMTARALDAISGAWNSTNPYLPPACGISAFVAPSGAKTAWSSWAMSIGGRLPINRRRMSRLSAGRPGTDNAAAAAAATAEACPGACPMAAYFAIICCIASFCFIAASGWAPADATAAVAEAAEPLAVACATLRAPSSFGAQRLRFLLPAGAAPEAPSGC